MISLDVNSNGILLAIFDFVFILFRQNFDDLP